MSTVHIEANKGEIASRVLMPGDPNRATYIAEKYLENPKLINKLRGELGYTGKYKGVDVTIFSSGMGIASMGIYSHELFDYYDVDTIIRIGTAGAYTTDLKIFDLMVVDSSYSRTTFDVESGIDDKEIINSSQELNGIIMQTAAMKGMNVKLGRVHTTEAFYSDSVNIDELVKLGCQAVEMETYALFYNAKRFKKQATAIITISDSLITHENMDPEVREKKLDEMIVLALESIIKK